MSVSDLLLRPRCFLGAQKETMRVLWHELNTLGYVSGHDFQSCRNRAVQCPGFSPLQMGIPSRNAKAAAVCADSRTFFVTSKTHGGRALLQSRRMAALFIDVLRSYQQQDVFTIHDFVVMPNHFHLLITVDHNLSIEKDLQFIKGNFSFRAKRELGVIHEIWQRGFSDKRVLDREAFLAFRDYIGDNPVKRGLAKAPDEYPYSSFYLCRSKKAAGAEAL